MNQWSQEQQQYNMISAMGGTGMGPGVPQGLLPNPTPGGPGSAGMMPPPVPPMALMNEWGQANAENITNFIGPKKTDENPVNDENNKRDSRDRKDSERDREKNRRARSPYRSRNDRSRSDRRERRPRWSDNNDQDASIANSAGNNPMQGNMGNMGNMMMPGNNMMQYNNMMPQTPMDMANMQHMNMMPGMNMMPSMMSNMMPNMPSMPNMIPSMDQNMMMQQQMLSNQPIYITGGVLLPPLSNFQLPVRRERPVGCRTIFVGGLVNGIDESIIAEMFQRFGGITSITMRINGVCHVRFEQQDTVELSFFLSGYRLKRHDQMDSEAVTLFIDYALNREDQNERNRRLSPPPAKYEPYSGSAMAAIMDKIKSDTEFIEAAPCLLGWLERGECNKKNSNIFYSAIQASNNQIRRLYNEKMAADEEFQNMKSTFKEKFSQIITQFEQVGKILTAAKVQRVSDQFSKQQRRNIEMWFKMTEDLENIKEEYTSTFEDDENDDKPGRGIPQKKHDELKMENERLQYELEGYKNEAFLAKEEAERKFEKFKAHFIAQQALQNNHQGAHPIFPPLPPAPPVVENAAPRQPPETLQASDAKLISIMTSFLLVHPLGASVDYLVSYVRSIIPNTTQRQVLTILRKYSEVFAQQTTGVGANLENKWIFVTFEMIKKEVM